jgi:hypothetical protein
MENYQFAVGTDRLDKKLLLITAIFNAGFVLNPKFRA